jgi:hypothetical protein
MITGMIKHFMFHILWIYILRFLYFNFFSASFYITFLSDAIATSINKHVLSFLFLIIMPGLFAKTYPFVSLDSIKQLYLHVQLLAWVSLLLRNVLLCTRTFLLY